MAVDALMLKHQATSTHSADALFIVMDQFLTKYCMYSKHHLQLKLKFDETAQLFKDGTDMTNFIKVDVKLRQSLHIHNYAHS